MLDSYIFRSCKFDFRQSTLTISTVFLSQDAGNIFKIIMVVLDKADKLIENEEPSEMQKFYNGSTIFVTGGSGFIGGLVIEKLLRSCPDIKNIFILMREKKGKSIEKRFEELLEVPIFDRIKREQPGFAKKCVLISGDCLLPELGLTDEDRQKFINEVNCVFHCAATVRFDESIRVATNINTRATRDILRLCKETKNLKSFVYVSTAFSQCINEHIKEEFYKSTINGESLIKLVEILNDDVLKNVTPSLIGQWPNTYVYTKSVAENIVETEGEDLPVAVIRPSIVISTLNEPMAGWINNMYGATGVLLGVALGLIRCLHCKPDKLADMVPADFVVNCSLAAAWEIGTKKNSVVQNGTVFDEIKDLENKEKTKSNIPIYNYVCSPEKPISWRQFMHLAEVHCKQVPSPLIIWYYCFFLVPTRFIYDVVAIFLHWIPAYCVDFLAYCIGKEQLLVKGYKKIGKFLDVLSFFSSRQWEFNNDNTQALWKKLNLDDQTLFNFNMKSFDWETYFYTYIRGGRVYLMKDPLDTLPEGRKKYIKLQLAHYTLVTLLGLLLLKCLHLLYNLF